MCLITGSRVSLPHRSTGLGYDWHTGVGWSLWAAFHYSSCLVCVSSICDCDCTTLAWCCGNHACALFSSLDLSPPLLPRLPISLLGFLSCCLSFPLVTCHRHSPYLAPCSTSLAIAPYRIVVTHSQPHSHLDYIYSPCTYCI